MDSSLDSRPTHTLYERFAAVQHDLEAEPASVGALCGALEDPHVAVQAAAARKLARCGDTRAAEPLIRALRASLSRNWVLAHIAGGTALVVLCLLTVLLAATSLLVLLSGGDLELAWLVLTAALAVFVRNYLNKRTQRSMLRTALAEALASIAEREHCPALRVITPVLRTLARDVVQQDVSSRAVCRQAAERIDGATREQRSLPVAATAPSGRSQALPRPAANPKSEGSSLPRVHP